MWEELIIQNRSVFSIDHVGEFLVFLNVNIFLKDELSLWINTIIAFIWGEHWKLSTCGWLFSTRSSARGEIILMIDNVLFHPHMKAITVLLYQNYSKMFNTWMFCFTEDNKRIPGIENTITEPNWKKDFQHTSCCQELLPSTLYMFGLFTRLFPSSENFP